MKKRTILRGFYAMIIAFLAVCFNGCAPTDEDFDGIKNLPPAKGTFATLDNTNITHDWMIDNQIVTDKAIASANLKFYQDGKVSDEAVSKRVDYTVNWEQPEKMQRSSPDFRFIEKIIGDKKVTGTSTSGNVKITTIERSHRFDYVGLSLTFKTVNHKAEYTVADKDGKKIVIAYNEEDSIVDRGQEKELIEKYWVNKEQYQRMKTYFNFDIHSTDYPSKSQKIQRFRPYIITESPVNVDPGKDIFEGVIPIDGTERLYLSGPNTYTSERKVWEFWSISGKKPTPTTLITHYEVKEWMSDPQEPEIIPSIEIGNPRIDPSSQTGNAYTKPDEKNFEFEKTTVTWNNTWLNGYNNKAFGSSERGWWMVNGIRIIEMPYSTHLGWFGGFTPDEGVEKEIDGKTYMNYQCVFKFSGTYNNDPFNLSQDQVFNVDKNAEEKPDDNVLLSETISKKLSNSYGNGSSLIIWTREYSKTGKIDSIASQTLVHSAEIEDKGPIVRPDNSLVLNETLEPQQISHKSRTDTQTGHVIDTWIYNYGFDFNFVTSIVKESYETAYTNYKGKKEEFLSDIPTISFNGMPPSDSQEVTGPDGKRYQRTIYTLKLKETYCELATILTPKITIDVADNSQPETDFVKDWKVTKRYDANDYMSYLDFWIKRNISGEKDSIASQHLLEKITTEPLKHIKSQSSKLTYQDVLDPDVSNETRTENGNSVTKTTTVHKFLFDQLTSKVTTEYETAKTEFAGNPIDYKVPAPPVVTYAGLDDTDLGIIKGDDGKDYNRTHYVIKYKKTFNGVTTNHTAEANIDVADEKIPVTRTKWSVLSKTIEKYDEQYQKSSFILHEEFSDGTQTNTTISTLLDTYATSPARQTIELGSPNLKFSSIIPGQAQTSTRKDGDKITVTVRKTPVTLAYEGISAISIYVDATAVYVDGEINITFKTSQFNYSSGGFDNPYLGASPTQGYDRYDCLLKLNSTYNNDSYNTQAPVYVDVKKAAVTRTKWEARDKGLQYMGGQQYRSYFTFYEEFSDGTNKSTAIETLLNIFGRAPLYRAVKLKSSEFTHTGLNPGAATVTNRKDGEKIFIVTSTTPYNLIYTNKENESLTSVFNFTSEEATFRDGDATVEFMTDKWNITNVGYIAPLEGERTEGINTYRRYNGSFSLNGAYHGQNTPLSANVDVDVLKGSEPNTPPEWGKILWDKTKLFGGGSYAWKKVGNSPAPIVTVSFIVENGVVNVTEGRVEFTKMDIARINSRVSAVLNVGGGTNYYTASTLEILKVNNNSFWDYNGYDGISNVQINAVDILKIDGVNINQPFIFTPNDTGTMNRYEYSDGRLLIYYKNALIYDGTSEK